MAKGLLGIASPGAAYVNPDMPPEVVRALAAAGFNPDGTPLEQGIGSAFAPTRQRLDAINQRISADWDKMGFQPTQSVADPRAQYVGNNTDIFQGANSPMANTGPDPFGQETRAKLAGINRRIDEDMAAMAEPTPQPAPAPLPPPRNPGGGMSYNPSPPPPPVINKAPIPIPRPRPAPSAYTIQAGDNPTTIARKFGMSLHELEAKNPGILKRARRLRPGMSVRL